MIKRIAILGAGTMGLGLARLFAKQGLRTMLYDPIQEALEKAKTNMQVFGADVPHTSSENMSFHSDVGAAVSDADFVIESAPENLEIKRQLYREIGQFIKPNTIVASNTSTFPLSTLSEQQVFADRFVIAHFFNPADIIPLVEIVKPDSVSHDVAERVSDFLTQCGKVPVILKKDIRGFVANRLQAAVLREACFLVEEGIVDAPQLDTVMKESIGMRWAFTGPFRVADYGGLDIWEKVLANLLPDLSNSSDVPLTIQQKTKQKSLGLKSGQGFYPYDRTDAGSELTELSRKLMALLRIKGGDA